jgi:hypothetical protein
VDTPPENPLTSTSSVTGGVPGEIALGTDAAYRSMT